MGGGHLEDLNVNVNDNVNNRIECPYELPPRWVRVDPLTKMLLKGWCCVGECTDVRFTGWWCDCFYGPEPRGLDPKSKWWLKAIHHVGIDYYNFLLFFIDWCKKKGLDLEISGKWTQGECDYVRDKLFEKYSRFLATHRLSATLQSKMFNVGWAPSLPPYMTMPAGGYYLA